MYFHLSNRIYIELVKTVNSNWCLRLDVLNPWRQSLEHGKWRVFALSRAAGNVLRTKESMSDNFIDRSEG